MALVSGTDEFQIDTSTPGEPGWWFERLHKKLHDRRAGYDLLEDYYEGRPPAPLGPTNSREVYRNFQNKARANWASLIVEAVRERVVPVGFRTGAEGDELGDAEAWRIWQRNGLDADSALVHRAMLSMGDAYVIVGVDSAGQALITPEDPREVVTSHNPANRREVNAALKVFADLDMRTEFAFLYIPGFVVRAERPIVSADNYQPSVSMEGWRWVGIDRLPYQVVPVVRFANRQNLRGDSMAEFEDVIDDIDRINVMLLQRLVVAVMQAFRQRAVKGVQAKDSDGKPIDWESILKADPGALWALPAGVDLWESGGVDLTPILESVKADVRDMAATTRTPMFYMFPDAANGSAEGASLQREGLVFKCEDRLSQTSDPWERVMSLAFLFENDTERASREDMEVLWAPPERFSLSERHDANVKAKAGDVPWDTRMTEILQYSPQQVARMRPQRATDVLLNTSFDAEGV